VNPDVILTAAEMREAEQQVIADGTPVETLMERAGMAAAEAVWRFAGPMPTLVLCGPGNNGGDGYVIARGLKARGAQVRVAALAEPASTAARWAREQWESQVEVLDETQPAALLIDALFGTGLTRPLDDRAAAAMTRLSAGAAVRVAIDLPSGAATDDGPNSVTGARLSSHGYIRCAETVSSSPAGGTAHGTHCRRRHRCRGGERFAPRVPAEARRARTDDHKYTRGYVAVLAGEMPGAAALAATAAIRAVLGTSGWSRRSRSPGPPRRSCRAGRIWALYCETAGSVRSWSDPAWAARRKLGKS
jgi:hydroxyethylthiazole kinase-like uncharacterized protein yjeF